MNIVDEYNKLYGDIPRGNIERFTQFVTQNKIPKNTQEVLYERMKRFNRIPWKKETLIMYIIPKGCPRPRSTSKGSFFYVKGAKDNKRFFEKAMKDIDFPIIGTPCRVKCISYLPIPRSMSPVDQILSEFGFMYPISRPDFDNLIKTYCDMVQGRILTEDSLVIDGRSTKFYSWKPRVEFTIEWMSDYDSEFNRKKLEKRKE